jgi:hypothetical protein
MRGYQACADESEFDEPMHVSPVVGEEQDDPQPENNHACSEGDHTPPNPIRRLPMGSVLAAASLAAR